jgi:hypothetical protein
MEIVKKFISLILVNPGGATAGRAHQDRPVLFPQLCLGSSRLKTMSACLQNQL